MVDSTATVAFRELYGTYGAWCDDARERPMTRRAMGLQLTGRGFEDARIGNDKAVTPDALLADLESRGAGRAHR